MAALCSVVVILAAACSGTRTGEPNAIESSPESSGASSVAKYGAPSVPESLDVKSIIDDACSALTEDQIAEFPGTLDKKRTSKTTLLSDKKTSCALTFQGGRYSYGTIGGGVALPRDTYHGISSIYKSNQQGSYETFRPVEIADYPAVINSESGVGQGECRLSVGLRDDTAYRISTLFSTEHPDYDEPCKIAEKFASFVVQNLKDGQLGRTAR